MIKHLKKTDPFFWLALVSLSLVWILRVILIPLPPTDSFENIFFNTLVRGCLFLIPFLIWDRFRRHKLKTDFALRRPEWIGVFWTVLYLVAMVGYEFILGRSFVFTTDVYILANVPFAPIIEELVYRGVVMTYLMERGSVVRAILLSTALFVMAHWPGWLLYSQVTPTEFLILSFQVTYFGLALGYIRYTSRSVYPPIVLHILNNYLSFGRV